MEASQKLWQPIYDQNNTVNEIKIQHFVFKKIIIFDEMELDA